MTAAIGRGHALIVVTEDWYFWSHRRPLARALRDAGFRVSVATRVDSHGGRIRDEGFELHDIPALRRGLPVAWEPATVLKLTGLYRRLKPDLVVQVALKPVVLGALAAGFSGIPKTLNILTGMGFVFTSRSWKARLLRTPIAWLLGHLLGSGRSLTVVQNAEDLETLTTSGVLPRPLTRLIRGSGVDIGHFAHLPEPEGGFTAAVVCRMLADKGIYDLVAAARILKSRGVSVRLLLVGPLDPLNPTAVREGELKGWTAEGLVEWVGPVDDVREVWRLSHIALLPSHREGLPKSLIEAAACGRAAVSTDTTGCREVVEDGLNGLLVPVRAPDALADAIERLAADRPLCRRLGEEARRRAVSRFSEAVVISQYLDLCLELTSILPQKA